MSRETPVTLAARQGPPDEAARARRAVRPRGTLGWIAAVFLLIQGICFVLFAHGVAPFVPDIGGDPFTSLVSTQFVALAASLAALVGAERAPTPHAASRVAFAGVLAGLTLCCLTAFVGWWNARGLGLIPTLLNPFSLSSAWFYATALGLVVGISVFEAYRTHGPGARAAWPLRVAFCPVAIVVAIVLLGLRLYFELGIFDAADLATAEARRYAVHGGLLDAWFSAPPSAWVPVLSALPTSAFAFLTPVLAAERISPEPPHTLTRRIIVFVFAIAYVRR